MRAESPDRSRARPPTSQGLAQPHPLLADQPANPCNNTSPAIAETLADL